MAVRGVLTVMAKEGGCNECCCCGGGGGVLFVVGVLVVFGVLFATAGVVSVAAVGVSCCVIVVVCVCVFGELLALERTRLCFGGVVCEFVLFASPGAASVLLLLVFDFSLI